MDAASIEVKFLNKPAVFTCPRPSVLFHDNSKLRFSTNFSTKNLGYATSRRSIKSCTIVPYSSRTFCNPNTPLNSSIKVKSSEKCEMESVKLGFTEVLVRRGVVVMASMVCGVLVLWCRRAVAVEGVVNVGHGVVERGLVAMRSSWPQVLQVLRVFKEQGLVLAALLGLSAFFSMAETSITTLWPWKVQELAEKEPDDGVFNMLRRDVTRFLTTILIGTTVINIGATALVTEAATAIFGEAGVSAA